MRHLRVGNVFFIYAGNDAEAQALRDLLEKNGSQEVPDVAPPAPTPTPTPVPVPPVEPVEPDAPKPPPGIIFASDILQYVDPDTVQTNLNVQAMGTAQRLTSGGIHGPKLPDGSTLRAGYVRDPASPVGSAVMFQLAYTDPITSGNKRAEFSFPAIISPRVDYWNALRVWVFDWGNDPAQGLFGTQLHSGDNSLGLSPSFGIYVPSGRRFRIEARHSTAERPSKSTQSYKFSPEFDIPFGRWADFVFKFRLDHNARGEGFLQAWMDGKQIYDYDGALGFNTPGKKDYFKSGLYFWTRFNTPRKILIGGYYVVRDDDGKYSVEHLRNLVNKP